MHPRRYPGKCRHGLDILHDYPIESKELLEKAQAGTLRLEEKPDDGEALASIFRAFHTIEGGAEARGYQTHGVVKKSLSPRRRPRATPRHLLLKKVRLPHT